MYRVSLTSLINTGHPSQAPSPCPLSNSFESRRVCAVVPLADDGSLCQPQHMLELRDGPSLNRPADVAMCVCLIASRAVHRCPTGHSVYSL